MRIEELSFAKVNLFLEVCARRDDGYHELDTVMHEVDLADRVIIEPRSEGHVLRCSDPSIPLDECNLALKALRSLERRVGRPLPCAIFLEKSIPAGGGMGGGSSNAAAVLRGLNRLHDLGLSPAELEASAAEFGSDTAFFVRGGTAWARGRGEVLEAIPAPIMHFALLFPGVPVATSAVFGRLNLTAERKASYPLRAWLAEPRHFSGLLSTTFNRLEEPARQESEIVDRLLGLFATDGVKLSGSGSTMFLQCESFSAAQAAARSLTERTGLRTCAVSSARR